MSPAACILVAVVSGMASSGCQASARNGDIASLRLDWLDIPRSAGGASREWRIDNTNSAAARLANALRHCGERRLVKFRPKYRIVAARNDGSETTFLVLGEHVKVDGVAFRCRQNAGELTDRLWSEGSALPH